ncbi:lipopolysaccharide assembly protein LapA domain-containing protein [Tahibacter amnicola]|uniref:Lipopolysaccharide assembly protein LapA domain-containing protein n=1 Tax=Tahibacter amnicola TaxID=2976241 RepID=A0ABY6BDD5_9GAMM|nr:lipopolysaccharide assembly protein LapA domain-containing protein [Tahibacter amnicola]UXI66626.1 lipopolysaccharide assembly protein LapA domain-containing protein [Tahibacter amnicola]
MRFVWIVLLLVFLAAGALFGALNSDAVALDFYFFQSTWPKGAALLGGLLLGWIAGGAVVWLAVVLPLKSRLSRLRREAVRREPVASAGPGAVIDP